MNGGLPIFWEASLQIDPSSADVSLDEKYQELGKQIF